MCPGSFANLDHTTCAEANQGKKWGLGREKKKENLKCPMLKLTVWYGASQEVVLDLNYFICEMGLQK